MRLLGKVVFAASDLHIGSPIAIKETAQVIERGIHASDISIFCGDIAEGIIRHTPFQERLTACKNAIGRWAEAATINGGRHTKPQFYLPGNHEIPIHINGKANSEASDLCAALREHCKTFPHVYFHRQPWMQMGDTIFTHGNRELGFVDTSYYQGKRLVDKYVGLHLQRWAAGRPIELFLPREEMANRLHRAFLKERFNTPINHIVFGHTHTPFTGFSVPELKLGGQDIQFHNTGVSYRRGVFNPLLIEFDERWNATNIRTMSPDLKEQIGR